MTSEMRLTAQSEERLLLFEVSQPVGVSVVEEGVHDIVESGVVPVHDGRQFVDGYSVVHVLVNDVDPLSVRDELS